jgi:alanine racemase
MPRPIRALIDRRAMAHNLNVVRRTLGQNLPSETPSSLIWAVIKANAYGHGIEAAVSGFSEADGLALLDFEEAERCRAAGWKKPILMLEGAFDAQDIESAVRLELTLVLHHPEQLRLLQLSRPQVPISVYLKLETGMNRLGLQACQYRKVYQALLDMQASGQVAQINHMTHFACADWPDGLDAPMMRFADVVKGFAGDWSLSNSAALLHHHQRLARWTEGIRSWVRPGICLYGGSPFDDISAEQLGIKGAMTLRSALISVRDVRAGEGVGYGYAYKATRDIRLGTVACGYADGYPRHAPTGTPLGIRGARVPLVGRVSMDMITVDITDAPQVGVGDEVILWGDGGPSGDEVAKMAGTISYELFSAVTARVPRVSVS